VAGLLSCGVDGSALMDELGYAQNFCSVNPTGSDARVE
jgi:hypothetical protein